MSKSNQLSTQPYRGTQDFFPEEMALRRYIFDTWRRVCEQFGYEEYQTPLLEEATLYRAKSGDEIGGKELFTLTDLKGRELAIRPEMTPSVTRMVARRYNELPKPIRLFNISNFMRQERPQRGRNREFWQLNFDVFGEDSTNADVEVLIMAIEIMKQLGAPDGSFVVKINSRLLLQELFSNIVGISLDEQQAVTRLMDKSTKLSEEEFLATAKAIGLNADQIEKLQTFLLSGGPEQFGVLGNSKGLQQVERIRNYIISLGYPDGLIQFAPSLVRGFDYYDGMIFEVFDTNPENSRSLFGGGRYNGLASLFGVENFPAVGCAPGDETLALFIKSWGIDVAINTRPTVYVPQLLVDAQASLQVAKELRTNDFVVVSGLSQETISQAVSNANKRNYEWVLIMGDQEIKQGEFSLKDMRSGEQRTVGSLAEVVEMIQS